MQAPLTEKLKVLQFPYFSTTIFGDKFIQLARSVYKFNDKRAKIKLAINNSLGSNIKEVKSYE